MCLFNLENWDEHVAILVRDCEGSQARAGPSNVTMAIITPTRPWEK